MTYGGFSITAESTAEGRLILRLTGELDLAQMDQLADAVLACDGHQRVVIDTTDLDFIDSSGLAALISARDQVGIERFTLVPGPATLRLLELTGTRDRLLGPSP